MELILQKPVDPSIGRASTFNKDNAEIIFLLQYVQCTVIPR